MLTKESRCAEESEILSATQVCTSGLTSQQRKRARELTERLGGSFDSTYTTAVTHLLSNVEPETFETNRGATRTRRTNRHESEKTRQAVQRGIPIVGLEWLETCARERRLLDTTKFRAGPMSGLNVTITGVLDLKCRQDLEIALCALGANYQEKMYFAVADEEKTDLLVANTTQSDKYNMAKEIGIPCVKVDYVDATTMAKTLLPFDEYLVLPDVDDKRTLLPIHEAHGRRPERPKLTRQATISKYPLDLPDVQEEADDLLRKTLSRESKPENDWILSGVKVFFFGFCPQEEVALRKILRKTGGWRCARLTGTVTHVVCKTDLQEYCKPADRRREALVRAINQHPLHPHVVHFRWLLESYEWRQAQNEEDYRGAATSFQRRNDECLKS